MELAAALDLAIETMAQGKLGPECAYAFDLIRQHAVDTAHSLAMGNLYIPPGMAQFRHYLSPRANCITYSHRKATHAVPPHMAQPLQPCARLTGAPSKLNNLTSCGIDPALPQTTNHGQ